MKTCIALIGAAVVAVAWPATYGAPTLSLVETGTNSTTSGTIAEGTDALQLDLRLDTDGLPVSGLEFAVESSPAGTLVYGNTPVTALGAPFTSDDLFPTLSAGDTVQADGTAPIVLFKNDGDDYSAFHASILQLNFDTHLLAPGQYVITPLPNEFTNAAQVLESGDFAQSQPFTLTVTAAPEPGALGALCVGAMGLLKRQRSRAK